MVLLRLFVFAALLFHTSSIYGQAEQNITFQHEGKTVYGTFAIPAGTGKFPMIIIAPGSGPNDRNGTATMTGGNAQCLYPGLYNKTLRPYKELSEALVKAGYAVLRYDKIEYTYSSNLGTITFKKLWLPVESAIGYVKTRSDVDTGRIILIGHSEGSSLIPYIARGKNIRALISLAGPRMPFDSIYAYQVKHITKKCGGDTNAANSQAAQILDYFNMVRNKGWDASTPAAFGVPASVWYDYFAVTDSVSDYYKRADKPTLFVGFGDDFNVPPSEIDRFQKEIKAADFYRIGGLNHFMTTSTSPNVSKEVTDTVIYWLKANGLSAIQNHDKPGAAWNIYPNPFMAELNIDCANQLTKPTVMRIMDSLGKVLWEQTISPYQKINTAFLKPGVYSVEINNGENSSVVKVVKH
jgi:dienelactone hydrolase